MIIFIGPSSTLSVASSSADSVRAFFFGVFPLGRFVPFFEGAGAFFLLAIATFPNSDAACLGRAPSNSSKIPPAAK